MRWQDCHGDEDEIEAARFERLQEIAEQRADEKRDNDMDSVLGHGRMLTQAGKERLSAYLRNHAKLPPHNLHMYNKEITENGCLIISGYLLESGVPVVMKLESNEWTTAAQRCHTAFFRSAEA